MKFNLKATLAIKEIISRLKKEIVVLDTEETLNDIYKNKKSISRFGDGEFELTAGEGIPFQKANASMQNQLKNILKNGSDSDCLVAIPYTFYSNKGKTFNSKVWWFKYFAKNREIIQSYLNCDKTYADSQVSRIYINRSNKRDSVLFFDMWKKIWSNKRTLIVEGTGTRFGVGNDLLDSCQSISRILCPKENAYEKYDEIKDNIINVAHQYDIILLCLGPTATVLAYELSHMGMWIIDLGNMDMEYEWMNRRAKRPIAIKGKYTIEARNGTNIDDCDDKIYYKQILQSIE